MSRSRPILSQAVGTYSLISDLPVVVDHYALEGLEQPVSSDFVRRSTVIRLHGHGEEGVGEDVTYDAEDQGRFQAAGPVLDLAGEHTLDALSARLAGLPDYRRWALRERGARSRPPAGGAVAAARRSGASRGR